MITTLDAGWHLSSSEYRLVGSVRLCLRMPVKPLHHWFDSRRGELVLGAGGQQALEL